MQGSPSVLSAPPPAAPGTSPAEGGAPAAPRIEVHCFGGFRVTSGGRELSPVSRGVAHYQPWELLAYLAAHPDGVVSREQLATALWPDETPQKTVGRVHNPLYRLRDLLREQVPGLKPTAGYPGDAARFLEAIRPAAERLGVPEAALWRRK